MTQPALTTHQRNCVASKKRLASAVHGAKSSLLARKKKRTAALLNVAASEVRWIRSKLNKCIVDGMCSNFRCNQSTSITSSLATPSQQIDMIPPISPPTVSNLTTFRYI